MVSEEREPSCITLCEIQTEWNVISHHCISLNFISQLG